MGIKGWLARRFHFREHRRNVQVALALPAASRARFASVLKKALPDIDVAHAAPIPKVRNALLKLQLTDFGRQRVSTLVQGANNRSHPEWLAYSMLESWATVALIDAMAGKPLRDADVIRLKLAELALNEEERGGRQAQVSINSSDSSKVHRVRPDHKERPVRQNDTLYPIASEQMSAAFHECWMAAARHLDAQAQGMRSWLKAEPYPPYLEHLSFRLGNQLFFVRLEDVDGRVIGPGSREGLRAVAEGCGGWTCLMRMRRQMNGAWQPSGEGWGLVDLQTSGAVDPPSTITDAPIAMSTWEVQDFAVQVVRDQIKRTGCKIISSQSNPKVDPAIWFVESDRPAWVVVRSVRFPALAAELPHNWRQIESGCRKISEVGYYASVAVAGGREQSGEAPDVRLLRGHPLFARFEGLVRPNDDDIDAAEEDFVGRGRVASRHRPHPTRH